ncbi:MAG: patatin-like phospholipase family protein, partial [Steroidobacteraceae bacterium]
MSNAHDSERGRLALVLAGGGSLGAVQVGMLAELVTAGVWPDFVVGEAGAINGAFFAHAPSAATVQRLTALWSRVTTREALGLSWASLLGLAGFRGHLANPRGLRGLLEHNLPYRSFGETEVPLHIVCAELVTGEEVVLSQGAVIEAVLASAAIPGVFPPVTIGGRTLVDGVVAAASAARSSANGGPPRSSNRPPRARRVRR